MSSRFTETQAYKFYMILEGSWASETQSLCPPIKSLVGHPEVKQSKVGKVVCWVWFAKQEAKVGLGP